MARSLNKATLIGNVGADPEVRTTGSGTRVAQFSVATSRSWAEADGTPHQRTEWHRVVAWGPKAEVVEQYLRKGERVYVEGEIHYRSYEDGEGITRYVTEINARDLLLLGGRTEDRTAETPAGEAASPKRGTAPRKPAAPTRGGTRKRIVGAAAGEDDLPF